MLTEKIEKYYSKEFDLNCAETMVYSANEEYGLNLDKKALKMASGFGGGMGIESVCGALTGGIMVLGVLFTKEKAHESERVKTLEKEFLSRYKDKMGDILCKPLKEKHHNDEVRCLNVIKEAGVILDDIVKRELGTPSR
ncbi:C-GCAxxG-C-C family (seleno)protein [Tepidanaerobacter syntrophicus]|uniref:C-GCAxxG-C-C family (seleno)protein n=1 Tax=Tepidanaerobacter syntrophicus TaxID=224999 RepID=UPI001BD606D1|nr:C-GCAxxG-C-C family (seleno)protein [Tepidanaerobacter syntrophicus]